MYHNARERMHVYMLGDKHAHRYTMRSVLTYMIPASDPKQRFLISSCFRIHRFPYKISHLCIYSCVHKRARVYACAYVCMYVSISVHMCASTSMYTARLSMNICTFEYMNNICTTMRENICMYTCSEANMHARCDLY